MKYIIKHKGRFCMVEADESGTCVNVKWLFDVDKILDTGLTTASEMTIEELRVVSVVVAAFEEHPMPEVR